MNEELSKVHQHLLDGVKDIDSPLDSLVHAQLKSLDSLPRAAITLVAAVHKIDSEHKKEQRIFLASALEMLYLALNIHKLLIVEDTSNMNKPLIGSIILAGDYCFSRAAALAVQTNNPEVVEIFSQSLKVVSEGLLRHLLEDIRQAYNENQVLFEAGISASARLNTISTENQTQLIVFSNKFADDLQCGKEISLANYYSVLQTLPQIQQERLQFFIKSISSQ